MSRAAIACMVAFACAIASLPAAQGASTGTSVVGATVPSATSIDAAGCATGMANVTEFGSVTPGSSNVTSADCLVKFGSSNDISTLRIAQADGGGSAMNRLAHGSFDTVFDTDGHQTLDTGGGVDEVARAIAVQADGKVVVAGNVGGDWLVARYRADGALDTAGFNAPNGWISFSLSAGADERVHAISILSSGHILAVGETNDRVGLARLNPAGVLDTVGFGAGTGLVVHDVPVSADEHASSVLVQPGGRIIVGGTGGVIAEFFAAYTAAGIVDTTWSAPDGLSANPFTHDTDPVDMAFDSSGRIVTVLQCFCGDAFRYGRLTADGAVDGTFGGGNSRTLPDTSFASPSSWAMIDSVEIRPDGTIMFGGWAGVGAEVDLALARVLADGSPDPAFNGDGAISIDLQDNDEVRDMQLQPDGTIVLGGASDIAGNPHTFVARVLANGSLDTTFNGTGWRSFDPPGTSSVSAANAIATGPDGVVYAAGLRNSPTLDDLTLTRFATTPVSNFTNLGGGGDTDWSSGGGTNLFGACLRDTTAGAIAGGAAWARDTVDGDCLDGDVDPWQPIPSLTSSPGAIVASAPSGNFTAEARLRFGLRVSASQGAGRYTAPVVFEVVAP